MFSFEPEGERCGEVGTHDVCLHPAPAIVNFGKVRDNVTRDDTGRRPIGAHGLGHPGFWRKQEAVHHIRRALAVPPQVVDICLE